MAEKYIRIRGKLVAVSEEVYLAYYRQDRKARFSHEKHQRRGVVSFDALDTDEMNGEDAIPDLTTPSVEDMVEGKMLAEQLHHCLAYFSASGETKKLVRTLADVVKADLFEIKPETPYTAADLDWHNKASRSSVEMRDTSCRPAMAEQADVAPYDTIFVGFPIWWYEAPRIIETFLESCDLTGKTVIPFATSGGSDLGNTDSILQRSANSDL